MINTKPVWKKILLLIIMTTLSLSGCSIGSKKKKDGPPKHPPVNLLKTPDAVPKAEPLSRYGNRFGKNKTNTYVALKKRYRVMSTSRGYRARGIASWYGTQFHGRKTSNGERYNMYAMTAAHPTLPLPTYVKVTNLENGKSVVVKINDRGPFHKNRIIDLSYVAAAKLGVLGRGTAKVEVQSIDPRDHGKIINNKKKEAPFLKKNLYLSLGKFNYRDKAEALMQKVKKISHVPIYITQQGTAKSPIFQVQVGPVANDEEAIKLTQKMARANLPPPIVITKRL